MFKCFEGLQDFIKTAVSDSDVARICGAFERYLCCIHNIVKTCDANTQKHFRDVLKRQIKIMSSSLSQCYQDLPNALDQEQTRCDGNKWGERTGSSTPRATMYGASSSSLAINCPSDARNKVLKCTKDFQKGFSSASAARFCGALKTYLCCSSNSIRTCDANTQKRIRDAYKAQMERMAVFAKGLLSQCNLDLPTALDQARTRCAGNKWIERPGSSAPRAAMSSIGAFAYFSLIIAILLGCL